MMTMAMVKMTMTMLMMRSYIVEFGRLDDICDDSFFPDPIVEDRVGDKPDKVETLRRR